MYWLAGALACVGQGRKQRARATRRPAEALFGGTTTVGMRGGEKQGGGAGNEVLFSWIFLARFFIKGMEVPNSLWGWCGVVGRALSVVIPFGELLLVPRRAGRRSGRRAWAESSVPRRCGSSLS